MTTTKFTKTKTQRRQKDVVIRIIQSTSGNLYALVGTFPDGYMVRIHDTTQNQMKRYSTSFSHSLPISIIKGIFKKSTVSSGVIRDGWNWTKSYASIRFGCQNFSGDDYFVMRNWALSL